MPSILLPWVEGLPLRHQGVLMSAMRGCDTAPRHDPSKLIQRLLRGAVLIPHLGKYGNPRSYIAWESEDDKWWEVANQFLRNWDHYPNHYVVHFIHATEIVGYRVRKTIPYSPIVGESSMNYPVTPFTSIQSQRNNWMRD